MPPTLLMLHGATSAGQYMAPLADLLRAETTILTPDLLGHGGRPIPDRFVLSEIADDVLAYLDERKISRTFVFGYSFGGFLALYLARHFPQRIAGISVLAAKYVYDADIVTRIAWLLEPERIRESSSRCAWLTNAHHPQDWVRLVMGVTAMYRAFGAEPPLREADLRLITVPALIFGSDTDQLVPMHETLTLQKLIRGSQIAPFKGRAHPLEDCPLPSIAHTLTAWMRDMDAAWHALWRLQGRES